MPDWKSEIKRRLQNLQLAPVREASIVEELAQRLDDGYAELIAGGATEAEAERRTLAELSGGELLARELQRPVAALAGYLPARRAARVDPLVALRSE